MAKYAYASTAYGVQGRRWTNPTPSSAMRSTPGDYVGITRGRAANRLHIVACDLVERQAEKWEHAAATLARLRDAHRAVYIE